MLNESSERRAHQIRATGFAVNQPSRRSDRYREFPGSPSRETTAGASHYFDIRSGTNAMIITDVTCECGASYRRAESTTLDGAAGQFICSSCGALVETWDQPKMRVYRLIIAPEGLYQHPKPPPSP